MKILIAITVAGLTWAAASPSASANTVDQLDQQLQSALASRDVNATRTALRALGRLGWSAQTAVPTIAMAYEWGADTRNGIMYPARDVLIKLGARAYRATQTMIAICERTKKGGYNPGCYGATKVLGAIGRRAVRHVAKYIRPYASKKTIDWSLGALRMMKSQGQSGDRAVLRYMRSLKIGSSPWKTGAFTLGYIRSRHGVRTLYRALASGKLEKDGYWTTVTALAQIGSHAKAALPTLVRLWQSRPKSWDKYFCGRMYHAFRAIAPSDAQVRSILQNEISPTCLKWGLHYIKQYPLTP